MKYDIFISYKRKGASSATAAYLYELLQQRGYNVFFDRKEMRSGKFNEQILEHISNANDIIILLEEESLGSWFNNRNRKEDDAFINNESEGNIEIRAEIKEEEPYKTDWFCKEVMHALSIQGKNIVPILLNGYAMPEGKDLPPEMAELSLHNALSLDISEIEEFYEKFFVEQGYLKSKPTNLSMTKRFQSKGVIVGCFLFYTDVDSCDLYECGEKITTLTDSEDEWHPFRYPVNFAGEHRFKLVNNDSCEVVTIKSTVETSCQQYVQVQFSDTRNLWELTKEEIDAQDDKDSLYNWGVGLYEGTTKHDPDISLSFECLSRAINLGSQDALDFIDNHGPGLVQEKHASDEVALKWYQIAAEHGNVEAQSNLGAIYYFGKGVKKNYLKAFELYTKAAEQGNADAQCALGVMYDTGKGVERNYAKAVELYTKAARQGDAYAQYCLGCKYFIAEGDEQDYKKAFKWFRKAAEQGNPDSQWCLGLMYGSGSGVEIDHEKAFEWFIKAAEQGDSQHQYNLGHMYFIGVGDAVPPDYEKAVEWFSKAAEKDDHNGQYCKIRLGLMYYSGEKVEQDYIKAFVWFRKAAELGDHTGQYYLGLMYYSGEGVEQDYIKAFEWFSKAKRGVLGAQLYLGVMYENGQGVERDYEKAVERYQKAIKWGDDDSLKSITRVYLLMGEYEKALPWAEKAVSAFPEDANTLDTLATVYEGLGRFDEALEQFEKCLKMYEENNDSEGIERTTQKISALKKKMFKK